MLYMTCPTCGYFIGQKILYYEEMKEKMFKSKFKSNRKRKRNKSIIIKSKIKTLLL